MRYQKIYNEDHGTNKFAPIVLVGNKKEIWDQDAVPESSVSERGFE